MQYFDDKAKIWKPLASTTPSIEANSCQCAASAASNLYVVGTGEGGDYSYRYDADGNVWEKQPHSCSVISNLSIIEDHMYAVSSYCHNVPQRYNFATRQWQSFAKISVTLPGCLYYSGATSLCKSVCSLLQSIHF